MDYHHPFTVAARNSKVDIAMVMLPSVNHTFARNFSVSPLLVNLGGPGGSGISFALGAVERLRQVVGEGQDIIGFDPRGVGESTPQVGCFVLHRVHNNALDGKTSKEPLGDNILRGRFNRMVWKLGGDEVGLVSSSNDALELLDQ
jgi:pimeloyl-ACP methyl ester carboxylesterase